jgi:hypothetical protein
MQVSKKNSLIHSVCTSTGFLVLKNDFDFGNENT